MEADSEWLDRYLHVQKHRFWGAHLKISTRLHRQLIRKSWRFGFFRRAAFENSWAFRINWTFCWRSKKCSTNSFNENVLNHSQLTFDKIHLFNLFRQFLNNFLFFFQWTKLFINLSSTFEIREFRTILRHCDHPMTLTSSFSVPIHQIFEYTPDSFHRDIPQIFLGERSWNEKNLNYEYHSVRNFLNLLVNRVPKTVWICDRVDCFAAHAMKWKVFCQLFQLLITVRALQEITNSFNSIEWIGDHILIFQ